MGETTEFYKANSSLDNKDTSYNRWPAMNVTRDLIEQGGLERDHLKLANDGFDSYLAVHNGSYRGNRFTMRWEGQRFFLITLEKDSPELVGAFSKVLGHRPFARYEFKDHLPVTFEWDFVNPDKRYAQLEEDERRLALKRLD